MIELVLILAKASEEKDLIEKVEETIAAYKQEPSDHNKERMQFAIYVLNVRLTTEHMSLGEVMKDVETAKELKEFTDLKAKHGL